MAAEDSMARGTHDWRTYRRLLAYVKGSDATRYQSLIQRLGLRH
jgi:ribosomal protein S15P/S13E